MDVNKKQLASVFGISERTFTEYQKAPDFPIKINAGRGKSNLYSTAQVHDWLIRRALSGAENETQKERLDRISANLKELEYAERVGALVPVEAIEPEWVAMVTACRSELMSRDDKLKAEIDAMYGIDLDLELLNDHTRSALDHLAGNGDVGESAGGPSGEAVRPAAADDDDRVG